MFVRYVLACVILISAMFAAIQSVLQAFFVVRFLFCCCVCDDLLWRALLLLRVVFRLVVFVVLCGVSS